MESKPFVLTDEIAIRELWDHFVVRGMPQAIDDRQICFYRSPENPEVRCAVGVLLTGRLHEDHPAWSFCGDAAGLFDHDQLSLKEKEIFSGLRKLTLTTIQKMHDASFPRFRSFLEEKAVTLGITLPEAP